MKSKTLVVLLILTIIVGVSGCIFEVFDIKPKIKAETNQILPTQNQITAFSPKDFINMTDSVFYKIKEQEIMNMLIDTAKAHGLKPAIFCGLSWHESAKFKYAHKKIMDSNKKWSYGLFMIQLQTAQGVDPKASEEKLLTPAYNAWIAAQLMEKSLVKYKRYDYAISSHNGTIERKDFTKKVNYEYVKLVYASVGEIIAKNDF
jgi:hypothetical protein